MFNIKEMTHFVIFNEFTPLTPMPKSALRFNEEKNIEYLSFYSIKEDLFHNLQLNESMKQNMVWFKYSDWDWSKMNDDNSPEREKFRMWCLESQPETTADWSRKEDWYEDTEDLVDVESKEPTIH
jgi:hypothetical protein